MCSGQVLVLKQLDFSIHDSSFYKKKQYMFSVFLQGEVGSFSQTKRTWGYSNPLLAGIDSVQTDSWAKTLELFEGMYVSRLCR